MPTRSGKERVPNAPQEPPRKKIKLLHQCHIPKELIKEKQIMQSSGGGGDAIGAVAGAVAGG